MNTRRKNTTSNAFSEDNGTVIGYASTWVRIPDASGDVVKRGAFSDYIKEFNREGRKIPLLFNHDSSNLDHYIGTVYRLEEDANGLLFEASFDGTLEAQKVRMLVKTGRIHGVSFAYDILEQGSVRLANGKKANELRKLNVHEVSLTPYPSNRTATVIDVKTRRQLNRWREERRKQEREELLRKAERLLNS